MKSWLHSSTFFGLFALVLLAPGGSFADDYFIRGDINADGSVELADAITGLGYLFANGDITCVAAVDSNGSGNNDIADATHLLAYLFSNGPAPASPFPECGPEDPAELGCESHLYCGTPPLDLTYSDPSPVYEVGVPIPPNVPSGTGGDIDTYTIAPELPEGLGLHPTTGIISGTPLVESSATDYVITGANPSGEVQVTLNITAAGDAPINLTYSDNGPTYVDGVAIVPNVPSSVGGAVEMYSVMPALPTGLSLDPITGVISGTPAGFSAASVYTVTAANGSGEDTVDLTITVASLDLPPHGFYLGPQLTTARYGHTATTLGDGRVLVVGGTYERHLTSLSTGEVFDPGLMDDPLPEIFAGAFIDTDFVGDPIEMANGGRVYHTATLLADGNVLIAGGSHDILISEATPQAELFDPLTREFDPDSLQITNDMIDPRFRHVSTLLPDGRVLITGGQIAVQETIIDTNYPPGHPLFQVDVETFPSTEKIEIFDPVSRTFLAATDLTGNDVEMVTPRGRSNLGGGTVAGFDGLLGTADDLVVFAGGFQTLSSIYAPQTKFPNQSGLDMQTGVEYYDLATGLHASAPNISTAVRCNDPILLNLGRFQPETVDGVAGADNLLLITGGDDNGLCRSSVVQSEIISVTFTGFGPSNGVLFGLVTSPTHVMNYELSVFSGAPGIGRSECPAILLPTERTYNGTPRDANWVMAAGGGWMTCPSGGQVESFFGATTNEVQGVMFFDPFYNADVDPPWDQSQTRGILLFGTEDLNPTGVIGTWLNGDSFIPDDSLDGFAGPDAQSVDPLVALRFARAYHTLNVIAGDDGIPGTNDDRALVIGGGASVVEYGGEPVGASCEVYVQP